MTQLCPPRLLFARSRVACRCTHSNLFRALSHSGDILVVEAQFTMAEKRERASDEEVRETAELILQARYPIALTGAGMSVESGIPPFRGPGGLWTKYGEPPMNGFQRFMADPKKAWEERLSKRHGELYKPPTPAKPTPRPFPPDELEGIELLRVVITQKTGNF